MQPRLVPILAAAALSLFALVPASAQDPAVPTSCTIDALGGSCEFLCVVGKSNTVTTTGVLVSASIDCPGEASDVSCSTSVGTCAGGKRVAEEGVGTCTASGVFVYRGACRGDA